MIQFLTNGRPGFQRTLYLVCLLALAATLPACGLAGLDDEDGTLVSYNGGSTLEITTARVPEGSSGVDYGPTVLAVKGARGTVSWHVVSGALPPGLHLTSSGHVLGTPVEAGYYAFTAQADDATSSARRDLAISIDTFGLRAVDGLHFGDAWSGVPVTLQCAGFEAGVQFEVVSNASGGTLHHVDAAAGSAVWVPGSVDAPGAEDMIRARCEDTGTSAEVSLPVAPDPTAGHVAGFGSTDVWYLDFEIKRGVHPYASDWHAALARLGLRGPKSTDRLGNEADQLADLVTRLAVLGHINRMFLRDADGTSGAYGLAISFPLERPGAGYGAPAPGTYAHAQPNGYNVMAVCEQRGEHSIYGMAFGDSVGNGRLENNSPGAAGELGIFVHAATRTVENTFRLYGSELREHPVSEADVQALKALLYVAANPSGRHELLAYYADALGVAIAYLCAHESGHSLGLPHTPSYVSGSIMSGGGVISPGLQYRFLPDDLDKLRAGLPGPGRGVGAQTANAELDQVHVCTSCDD